MSGHDLDRYIKMFRRTVANTALFIVKNPADAEDIAQDVFLKLYTFSGKFTDDEHVKAWLLRCTINRCFNHLRSAWHKGFTPLDAVAELPSPNNSPDSEVSSALAQLDPKLRAVLYLHYYEGYPIAETAKILRISSAAVKWRLKRGRNKLRELIKDRSDPKGERG